MIALLWLSVLAGRPEGLPAIERVDTVVQANVAADLETVRMRVVSRIVRRPVSVDGGLGDANLGGSRVETSRADGDRISIALPAERFRQLPPSFTAVRQRELFRGAYSFGGLAIERVLVDGKACAPEPADPERDPDGTRWVTCPFGQEVTFDAVLQVPERYGAFGVHANQLLLAGGWYPLIAERGHPAPRGAHRLELTLPAGHRAIGPREDPNIAQLPLLVIPPNVHPRALEDGRAWLYTADHESAEANEIRRALRDAMIFNLEHDLPLPTAQKPWVVLTGALRHELAIPLPGLVLLSDRAFRMFPVERFLRFHRFPVLRALYAADLLARGRDRPEAEAIAAARTDLFVESRHGRAEDAFDVLGFWSFIPAVDLLLYAPDVPFESAYFRRVDERDPLSPSFVDHPSPFGHGRLIYEKLLDRLGKKKTREVFARLEAGASLLDALAPALGGAPAAEAFLDTWQRPYPSTRYRLLSWSTNQDNLATITIERDGEAVAEPLQVRLVDENDLERVVWTETTSQAIRTLTATMSAPLDRVELDPFGRLIETPTDQNPSPRFDNRSSPRWKILLNNWNISVGATEGTLDTALDFGFSREYDVRWRHAIRGDFDPAAIGLSARSSYAFGESVTRSRLLQSIGAGIEGAYLRPKFGDAVESAFVAAGRVFWSYDDRQSLWAAEPGSSFSATLEYSHVFGQVLEAIAGGGTREVSADALSLSARAVRSWRFGGSQQLTARATAGAFLFGDPRRQILFRAGGRANMRGYPVDATLGEARGVVSLEWGHPILPELNDNAFGIWSVTGMDGALYADAGIIADELSNLSNAPFLADVGYGIRLYIDYFGVRPGVMAVDLALPLFDIQGRRRVGDPAVYIDFSQSF